MSEHVKNSHFDYNLRWWVQPLQLALFFTPFLVFNQIAESALEHARLGYPYLEAIIGCSVFLISAILIGTIPRLAKFCAKDSNRVEATMRSSLNTAAILSVTLFISAGLYWWDRSSP